MLKAVLYAVNITALFFMFYYLWDVISYLLKRYKYYNVGSMVDRQVITLMERSEKTKGLPVKIEKMLRATSIRPKDRPLKIRHFVYVTGTSFFALFILSILLLNNPLAGVLLGCVAGILPYQLLQFDYRRNQKKLKKQTAQFLLAVANMFGTYGDPVVALDELSPRLKNPLKREVIWFTDNMKFGVPARQCVETVKSRLPDRILKDFFDDLMFYLQYGGNFYESISNLVKQTYDRETMQVEKSTATSSTVTMFFVLVGVYFIVLFALIKMQPGFMSFLTNNSIGKMIVVVMICIFIIAGYFVHKVISTEGED
ncbi:MAG: type II secretion system F family protein [Clostridiales bacterium]|nr:type II secretion system F family protein [Clostridiales bacterium]MCF8022673.1 type II secretion system F family protein [Clostridiales bacterium]